MPGQPMTLDEREQAAIARARELHAAGASLRQIGATLEEVELATLGFLDGSTITGSTARSARSAGRVESHLLPSTGTGRRGLNQPPESLPKRSQGGSRGAGR
jgi:hypothetical protein